MTLPASIAGVLPVAQLPYHDDDSIDFATLQQEIEWLFAQGVDGITLAMVTEFLRLTDAERELVIRRTVEFTKGRGPVIASVGDESLVQVIQHARAAEQAGAAAVMALPPALTNCGPPELLRYYETLLETVACPVIVQDASGYVGTGIPVAVQAELFHRHPGRVLFKPEARPFGPTITALREATGGRASVFEGTGGLALLDSYPRGICGVMPGADLPWALVALWRALQAGDDARARAIHEPLVSLISLLPNLDGFLAVEKFLLHHQGIFRNTRVRGPVGYHLDVTTAQEILRLVARLQSACA